MSEVERVDLCDDYVWNGYMNEAKEACQICGHHCSEHPQHKRPKLTGRERSKLFRRIAGEIAHQKFINGVKT